MPYTLCSLDVVTPRYRKELQTTLLLKTLLPMFAGGWVVWRPLAPCSVHTHPEELWVIPTFEIRWIPAFCPLPLCKCLLLSFWVLALSNLLCSLFICRARGLWGADRVFLLTIYLMAILWLTLTTLGHEFPVWVSAWGLLPLFQARGREEWCVPE